MTVAWLSIDDDHELPPQISFAEVSLPCLTNSGSHGVQSATYYNSYSLLKSMEAALGLPCLNHACDKDVKVMSDLFRGQW